MTWDSRFQQKVGFRLLWILLAPRRYQPHNLAVDACDLLKRARRDGFSFITTSLPLSSNETRSDVLELEANWWRTSVVGVATTLDKIRFQLEWAKHMNLPVVLLPPIGKMDVVEYANAISNTDVKLWVPVDLSLDGLDRWHDLYRLCGEPENVGMMLRLSVSSKDATSTAEAELTLANQMRLLHLVIGQPVKAVAWSTSQFLINKKGFPTLSKLHQWLLAEFFIRIGRGLMILVDGDAPSPHATSNLTPEQCGDTDCLPYLQYLKFCRQKKDVVDVLDTKMATDELNYLDGLQSPLQPLRDHLQYQVYETFEMDPVKYAQYEKAVGLALADRFTMAECTILVVGAGRGPLVSCALRAFRGLPQGHRPARIKVFAIEKNPSAVLYLNSKAKLDSLWKEEGPVTVIEADLRTISSAQLGGYKADVVVSELLGSFGDNELSPECLDSLFCTDVCKAGTVSIPSRYTAFLAPVSSSKLHQEVRSHALYPNETMSDAIGMQKATETWYVVRPHQATQMCKEQECWEFAHPRQDEKLTRFVSLDFPTDVSGGCGYRAGYGHYDAALAKTTDNPQCDPVPWRLHGFLGSFSAELYRSTEQDVSSDISIAPSSFSVGMFSWFPLYFPLREPLWVPVGAAIRASMRRCVDEDQNRVWYEWSASILRGDEILASSHIHNPGGRSCDVSS